jgi:polysaccharide biosynthesis/export protein
MVQRCLILLLSIIPFLFSCVHSKKIPYFSNLADTASFGEALAPQHIIRKGDVLSIVVNSLDPEASRMFNLSNRSEVRTTTPTGDELEPAGYLVNKEGNINFLMLGMIRAEGATREELQQRITRGLVDRKLLLDPIVEIRHLNFKVTVLGEVVRPTVITVPNEQITLMEALGLAGDLTIFAKRTNVLVIRNEGNRRTTNRIDLNSTELFNSPYYFLQPNDVVYVAPNKAREMSASRLNQWLPAIVSSFSVLIVVIDRLTR